MALHFTKTLPDALEQINFQGEYKEFIIHEKEELRTLTNSDEMVSLYGKVKWEIVDILNQEYSMILEAPFDLYHWLDHHENDEVAYFINEAGSNCLNYAEFKMPSKFHLWLGRKGFVIGIEQKGKGFNAKDIHQNKQKENQGAAFDFFRRCDSVVFFDQSQDASTVYLEYIF